jgi:hypothetical protein
MMRTSSFVVGLAFAASVVALPANAQCLNNVPHLVGTWTTLPYGMPVNPISATLLRTGKVLVVAGSENDANNNSAGADTFRNVVWDPTVPDVSSLSVQNMNYDVFCSGTAQLPHGRTLTMGGTSTYSFTGESRASAFDPITQKYVQSQSMADGRWYGTATALGDGRIMVFSGLGNGGGINNNVEIYDLAPAGGGTPGWGSAFLAPFSPPLFPRQFLLPNGTVFFTAHGSGTSTAKAWIFDPGPKSWASSVNKSVDRRYGSAVILPLLPPSYTPKVMMLGGGSPVTNTTEIIDLSVGSPHWTNGPAMSASRIQMNAVLLPDGKVLAEGGSAADESGDPAGKNADLYDSVSGGMASAGTSSFSRLYHSTAVLLPDATVASMGSNPGDRGKYLGRIEIYTPPYLYDANDRLITDDRPAISNVNPAVVGYGGTLSVDYTATSAISSAVLVRPGSTTHAFDMDQRVVGLCGSSPQPPCSGSGTLMLSVPSNGNVAPPGYYMLFILDAAGVPSHAAWVELAAVTAAPPDGAISSPATDVTINAGGTVSFSSATTASRYTWVFPGGNPAVSSVKNPGIVSFATAGKYRASLTLIDAANNTDPSPATRDITVLPTAADFQISVTPASRTVVPGGSATYSVTITPLAGFNGNVTLSVSSEFGFPSGMSSGGFSPATISGSGTSTLTMLTTTSTVPYATSLTIKGVSGSPTNKTHTTSATLLVTILPPDPVSAAASEGTVSLLWPSVVGATSYRVSRSPYAGGPYQAVACTSSLGYTDSGLTNGTTYYYTLSSLFIGGPNIGGSSAAGTEVSATPPCPVPGYAGSLTVAKSGGGDPVWAWSSGGATAYDLVTGDLEVLRSTGGDFTAALAAVPPAEAACLADDTDLLSITDANGVPALDEGYFVVLRPAAIACPASGTFDEGQPAQLGGRDAEIAASPRACP